MPSHTTSETAGLLALRLARMALDTFGSVQSTTQDRVDLADYLTGEAVRWINERFEVGLRETKRVRDLEISTRFSFGHEVWRVSQIAAGYVEARSEQFSVPRVFYDPVTAAKAGEHSWDLEVEVFGGSA